METFCLLLRVWFQFMRVTKQKEKFKLEEAASRKGGNEKKKRVAGVYVI